MPRKGKRAEASNPHQVAETVVPCTTDPPEPQQDRHQQPVEPANSVQPVSATDNLQHPAPAVREAAFTRLLRLARAAATDEEIKRAACDHLLEIVDSATASKYNILVIFDDSSITESDADKIYAAVQTFPTKKPILLVLESLGGQVAPAYFISKICREYADGVFAVGVPRRAKSAATLICCGADKIHMGSLSELGPIDPQVDRMPALGVKQAMQHIADLVKSNPASSEMFASYLAKTVRVAQLGYFERVAESAVQYAERLLHSRITPDKSRVSQIARQLVYEYKDHGFAIDAKEAVDIFGTSVIEKNSQEYAAANSLYDSLGLCRYIIEKYTKRNMYFVGALADGCYLGNVASATA